jgi:hypothetical protein
MTVADLKIALASVPNNLPIVVQVPAGGGSSGNTTVTLTAVGTVSSVSSFLVQTAALPM